MKKQKTKKKSKSRSLKKKLIPDSTGAGQSSAVDTSPAVSQQAVQKKATAEKKATAKQASAPRSGGPVVWFEKTVQFFREVKVELKKVTWPSRKETLTTSSVVVVLVLVVAVFLGLVDFGLSKLIRTLVG